MNPIAHAQTSNGERLRSPASSLRRLAAFVLDLGVMVLIHFTIAQRRWVYTAVLYAVYHTICIVVGRATVGKAIMGLSVQRPDGTRLVWWVAMLRSTVGYLASGFFLLGFVYALRDERRRCWHDVLFGSEVVQRPGVLSIKRIRDTVDEWSERIDTWQQRLLKRYRRLQGLVGLLLKLTGLMTVLQTWLKSLVDWLARKLRLAQPKTAGVSAGSPATPAAATGSATTIRSGPVITASVLATITVVTYEIIAPPGLRPWDPGVSVDIEFIGEEEEFGWTQQGPPGAGNWVVAEDRMSVVQTANGEPTFFVSPEEFIESRVVGKFRVEDAGDDDYIGFVFGYKSPLANGGEGQADYEFLLFDWKAGDQGVAPEGLSVARVSYPASADLGRLWSHVSGPEFEVLASDFGAGKGWRNNVDYEFELRYQQKRIRISINGELIFSVRGTFPSGGFGFYNYSQPNVRYWGFSAQRTPR